MQAKLFGSACVFYGTPGRSRTCDLQNRNLTLYPTELRVCALIFYYLFFGLSSDAEQE